MENDPAFASAVERAYLKLLESFGSGPRALIAVHHDYLEAAIHDADPTNGGLRFKRLANRDDLDRRLFEALGRRSARTP